MNHNCFQSESQAAIEDTQLSSSHSLWKRHSGEGNKCVFPDGICLFCDKKTTISGGKIFKPTETFTSWGHKKSWSINIEQMARDLQNVGYSCLLRKVAGVYLFVAESHFHRPCYSKYYGKHQTCKSYHRSPNADEWNACSTCYCIWILEILYEKGNNLQPDFYALECSSWPLYPPTCLRKLSQSALLPWEVNEEH